MSMSISPGISEIRLTLPGDPRTKKNSQQILTNRKTGRPFVSPSAAYRQYARSCVGAIPEEAKRRHDERVHVRCLYYMHTRRAVDLSNLLEATDDILVGAGVLADDNCRIIASHDGSRVYYDKLNPRVEITITPFCEDGTL